MAFFNQKETGGGGAAANPQTPSGTVDGSNTIFTVTLPLNNLYVNEGFQTPNVDYTLSGTTITFVVAPPKNSVIYAT